MHKYLKLILLAGFFGFFSCTFDKAEKVEEKPPLTLCDSLDVTYAGVIKPLITNRCAISGCHVSGFSAGDFTSYQGLKDVIDQGSTFRTRIIIDKDMPPAGATTLSDEERQKIDCWLNDGAQNN